MKDKLILRSQVSPYGDTTKGSVLSHAEVDNNFINLKGGLIYSANSSSGIVNLLTLDGETISFSAVTDDIYVSASTLQGTTLKLERANGSTLTTDLYSLTTGITGGTYNANSGEITFYTSTGGTFTVGGFATGYTDTRVSDFTYTPNVLTIRDTVGDVFNATINTMTGLTITDTLNVKTISATSINPISISSNTISATHITANTISATTYQGLPTDVHSTGFSYSNNTFTITDNTGGTLSASINTVTGLTVNGNVTVTGQTNIPFYAGGTGSSFTLNFNNSSNQTITLTANTTMNNPTNIKDGAIYSVIVKQSATGGGSKNINSWGTAFKFENGTAPSLSTGTTAVDIITFLSDGTNLYGITAYNFN